LKAYSNDLFNFVTVSRGKERVALIIEEDACHSYTILNVKPNEVIMFGSNKLTVVSGENETKRAIVAANVVKAPISPM
ncbi:MAG: hypothetical protein EBS86_11595, partial [Crocinitomicaceae bacterium]|nr:hypothetical protein [Crocinitomicaceae bacterium]